MAHVTCKEPDPIEGKLDYLKRLSKYQQEKPYVLSYGIPLQVESFRSNLEYEEHCVRLLDIRTCSDKPDIDQNGFEVIYITDQLMSIYFGTRNNDLEIQGAQRVLRERFKAEQVIVYDYTRRREESTPQENLYNYENRPSHSIVVRNPHADQTRKSGLQRLNVHLSTSEFQEYMQAGWRLRIVNFWKPINHAVESSPLIFCESSSICETDKIACDVVSHNYVGESVFLHYSENHNWLWLSNQRLDEAFIFVSYDTQPVGNVEACFHSSCAIPSSEHRPPNPRESMEVRAIVITKEDM
ncbi:hypothetical protein F4805DRAFT_441729 [Annulohypoxylon moriforme]|nr:hypothetical protein F4805DRAFT_441729 [Annulohypoxylon moriforme]